MKYTYLSHFGRILLWILLCPLAVSAATPVRFKIDRDATGTYRVYMNSTTAYTGNPARVASAQVTIQVPTGSFTAIPQGTGTPTITGNNGMGWTASTRVNAPSENPGADYISFGFSQSATPTLFNIPANTDVLLFSFSDNGICPGVIKLWSPTDPFQGFSTTTNPGNQITILGNGGDAYGGNLIDATSCGSPDLISSVGPVPALTAGQTSSLPVSLSNVGTAAAPGPIGFATTLPTGVSAPATFTSNGFGCTTTGQSVSCSSPSSLPAGGNTAFAIPITPAASTVGTTPVFSGTATGTSPESNTANNAATPVAASAPVQAAGAGCTALDCNTGVRYGLKLAADGITYTVFMKSATAYSGSQARIATAQVTVNFPASTQITNLQNLQTGMSWVMNAQVNTPTEAPSREYMSFGYSQSASPSLFTIASNAEIPLFSFQRVGACSGDVQLWNTTDPFQGQSTSTNPGNQMTILGNGVSNAWMCNYTCPVVCPAPVLSLVKQAPASITQNTPFDYNFTVTNSGNLATSGAITVTDVLPAGLQFVSGSGNGWTCSALGQTVSCTTSNPIAISASSSFIMTVNPTQLGTISNNATVTGGGSTTVTPSQPCAICPPGSTTSTVGAQPSDLSISITQPGALVAGQANALTIPLTNLGPGVASGPQTITLTMPAGVSAPATFTSAGGWGCSTAGQQVVCSNPASLSANQTLPLVVPVIPASTLIGNTLVFSVTAAASSTETNLANNTTTITTSAPVVGSDLAIAFGQLPTLVPGQAGYLPITITNVGQATAPTTLTVAVTLPAGFSLSAGSLPAGWSLLSSTAGTNGTTVVSLQYTGSTGLTSGSSLSANLPVTIAAGTSGTANFVATLTPVASESNTANNTATTSATLGSPDLQVTLSGPVPALVVGQPSTVTVTVQNVGNAVANGPITVKTNVPAGYSINQSTIPAGWSVQSATTNSDGSTTLALVSNAASLTPTQSVSFELGITPGASVANVTGTLSTTAVSVNGETNLPNNVASVTVTPVAPRIVTNLTLPAQFTAGQPTSATIAFSNAGTAGYTGPVTAQLTIPSGVTAGALPTGWSYAGQVVNSNGTTTYTITNPNVSLPIGGSTTVLVPLTAPTSLVGQQLPVTVVTAPNPSMPSNTTSTTQSSPVVAQPAPNVIVSIGVPNPGLSVGQVSTIPISFTNIGNGNANGPISTTISLPAGVSVLAGQLPAGWVISGTMPGPNGSTIYTLTNPTTSIPASGGQLLLNLPVTVSQAAAGSNNPTTATIQPTGQTTPGTATTNVVVTAPNVILTVGQPTPSLVVGQTSVIPVTIQNTGNGSAYGPLTAQVTLPAGVTFNQSQLNLPAGWTLVSNTPGPNGTTNLVFSNQNSTGFAPGSSVALNIPVTPTGPTAGTTVPFSGTIAPVQGQTTGSSQTSYGTVQQAPAADLTISGGQPQPNLVVGQTSTLPITIQNVGNAASTAPLSFSMSLPAGATINTAQLPVGWSIQSQSTQLNGSTVVTLVNTSQSLAAGQSTTVNVPVTPAANLTGATLTIGLYVNPTTGETNLSNNAATVTTTVPVQVAPAPDLAVTVPNQSFTLIAGQVSSVAFNVANIGNAPATGPLTLQFTMPTGFSTQPATFSTGGWGCSTTGNVVSCTNTTGLAVGASTALSIPVLPTGTTAGMTNPSFAINVTPATGETVLPNNVGAINYQGTVQGADLAIGFPNQSFTLTAGQTANVLVQVTNTSLLAPATGPLSVTFTMPVNFSTAASTFTTNGWTCSLSGTTVGCTTPNGLAPGASTTLTMPVVPLAAAAGSSNLIFGAAVAPVAGETNLANNVANLTYAGSVLPGGVVLAVKALLQGAYELSTGLMQDKLRQQSLVPLTQPYGTVAGGNAVYTFIGSGSETTTASVLAITGANAIVDWVMVELRSATNSQTVVATKPALIQRDGDVVSSTDGVSPVQFANLTSGSYYVTVRHRNHLGAMSAQAITLTPSPTTVDMTNIANVYKKPGYGNYPEYVQNGKAMLWAGNTDGDAQVIFQGPNTDVDPIFYRVMSATGNTGYIANYITTGYDVTDVNMDGTTIFQGPNNEVDVIFFNVVGHPENTGLLANYIIQQQLP